MWKWILLLVLILAIAALAAVIWYVQHEEPFRRQVLAEDGRPRALILYHPSRDAHFSDELTEALARGFARAGYSVERWTMADGTPVRPDGFDLIAVVSNTFFWAPDRPSRTYLGRADFHHLPVIAIMAGGGSTRRAELALAALLTNANADLREVRPLWISRPNGKLQPGQSNRMLAGKLARDWAFETANSLKAEHSRLEEAKITRPSTSLRIG